MKSPKVVVTISLYGKIKKCFFYKAKIHSITNFIDEIRKKNPEASTQFVYDNGKKIMNYLPYAMEVDNLLFCDGQIKFLEYSQKWYRIEEVINEAI